VIALAGLSLVGASRPPEPAERSVFTSKRAPRGATAVPTERYAAARQALDRLPRYSSALNRFGDASLAPALPDLATWTPLGPGNIGGRTRTLVADPSAPGTLYAAGVAGGVWKSTDSGGSWEARGDALANLAVSSLALDPADPATLVAGTGEGFFNDDALRGAGLFKTTDGGASWQQLAATNTADFYYVNDVVFSPLDPQRLYAATGTGVWQSLDGGTSWARTLDPKVKGGCLDLAIRSDRPTDVVFASCGTFAQAHIYRNSNGAGTPGAWSAVWTEVGMGRTSLALAPSNQDWIYALSVNINGGTYADALRAVYRSTDGGTTWEARVRNSDPKPLNRALLSDSLRAVCIGNFKSDGWYNNVVAVDPVDADVVWAGGVDLFRSDDGGHNWGLASYNWLSVADARHVHGHQHALVFHPSYDGSANKTLWIANDGGLYQTLDARAKPATSVTGTCSPYTSVASAFSFSSLNNGYAVTQFNSGAVYPDDTRYFGGTQGNGIVRGTDAAGPNAWETLEPGDGGAVAVDPTNPNVLYGERFGLSFLKSTDDGFLWRSALEGTVDFFGTATVVPFVVDPVDPQRLWMGGQLLWRTGNAAEYWEVASSLLNGYVTSIAVSPSDPNAVLAATTSGRIYRNNKALITQGSTIWPSAMPGGGYASSVAFDPRDPKRAYATYSSFGVPHVWKSTDAGASWASLDGTTFPDVPAHVIVADPTLPGRLFVGTDLGVLVSLDGGASWAVENTGFPNVITEALVLNGANLYAFTHGRGVWRVALSALPQSRVARTLLGGSEWFEGQGDAAVEVELTTSDHADSTAPVTVDYRTVDGTAIAGADYVFTSGTLSFPAGSPSGSKQTVTIPILDDTLSERRETFRLELSNGAGAQADLRSHVVTIRDNATVQFKVPAVSVSEGAPSVTVAVERIENDDADLPVQVHYRSRPGTAQNTDDYAGFDGVIELARGGIATRQFALVHDSVHEGPETFFVQLYQPSAGAQLGAQSTLVVTILDNDPVPTLQFSGAAYTASEAGGIAKITVRRSGSTAGSVTVDYATGDGTATAAGGDYTSTAGTLTFGPNVVIQTFGVPILNDTTAEPPETVRLTLSTPGPPFAAELGALPTATLTITDDDQAVQFGATAYTVSEAAGKALITVKRSGGLSGTVTVDYASEDGTATVADGDYSSASGHLSFGPGVASRTFEVKIANDTTPEPAEALAVRLLNPSPGLTLLGPNPVPLTIADDDGQHLQFSAAAYRVREASAQAVIQVRRTGGSMGSASVQYSVSAGTASDGADFIAKTGSLTFGQGVTTASFGVDLIPDTADEPDETIQLTLGAAAGAALLGAPSTAVLTVTDDDTAGVVQFQRATYSVDEAAGSASITVVRSGGTSSEATVVCSTGPGPVQSADAGADYLAVSTTLTFAAGETVKACTVPILDDSLVETSESVSLTLSGPAGGLALGPQTHAVLWIVDDE
jgi:hypothetical protein